MCDSANVDHLDKGDNGDDFDQPNLHDNKCPAFQPWSRPPDKAFPLPAVMIPTEGEVPNCDRFFAHLKSMHPAELRKVRILVWASDRLKSCSRRKFLGYWAFHVLAISKLYPF